MIEGPAEPFKAELSTTIILLSWDWNALPAFVVKRNEIFDDALIPESVNLYFSVILLFLTGYQRMLYCEFLSVILWSTCVLFLNNVKLPTKAGIVYLSRSPLSFASTVVP